MTEQAKNKTSNKWRRTFEIIGYCYSTVVFLTAVVATLIQSDLSGTKNASTSLTQPRSAASEISKKTVTPNAVLNSTSRINTKVAPLRNSNRSLNGDRTI